MKADAWDTPLIDLEEALGFAEDASSLGVAVRLIQRGDPAGAATMLRAVARDAEKVQTYLVADLRKKGKTWAAIGELLGISTQAANKRYGHLDKHRRFDVGRSRS